MKLFCLSLAALLALSAPAFAKGAHYSATAYAGSRSVSERFSLPKEGSPDVRRTENVDGLALHPRRFDGTPSATISRPPDFTLNIE